MNEFLRCLNQEKIGNLLDKHVGSFCVFNSPDALNASNVYPKLRERFKTAMKNAGGPTQESKLKFLGLEKPQVDIDEEIKHAPNNLYYYDSVHVSMLYRSYDFQNYVENAYTSKVLDSEIKETVYAISHLSAIQSENERQHKAIVEKRGFWARHFKVFRTNEDKSFERTFERTINYIKAEKKFNGQYLKVITAEKQLIDSKISKFEEKNSQSIDMVKTLSDNLLAQKIQRENSVKIEQPVAPAPQQSAAPVANPAPQPQLTITPDSSSKLN